MNYPLRLLVLPLLCLAPLSARADFSVNLDAGELTGPLGASMPSDNTLGSPAGSLLLLLDLGGPNDTVSNSLTAGHFVSGNDFVLAAGGFNTNGGTNETLTAFNSIVGGTSGDEIALRWFPQITFAQYLLGATPTGGSSFGTYNPSGANPDGGDTWTVPSSGLINLDFFTSNSDFGGMEDPSAGYANFQVAGSAVPEPSTYALLGCGMAALIFVVRRRNKISGV